MRGRVYSQARWGRASKSNRYGKELYTGFLYSTREANLSGGILVSLQVRKIVFYTHAIRGLYSGQGLGVRDAELKTKVISEKKTTGSEGINYVFPETSGSGTVSSAH